MDVKDIIKTKRIEHNLTMKELAIKVGVSEPTISRWESGEIANMRRGNITALAKALQVPPHVFIDDTAELPPSRPDPIRVNVYSCVPAGTPIEAMSDNIIDIEELDPSQFNPSHDYIGLLVKGDSMYPRFMDGDVIIVKIQPDCESGQDAVVYVNGYDATLKTVYKHPDCIELRPVNPSYPPRKYGPEDEPLQILGIVKELRRKF